MRHAKCVDIVQKTKKKVNPASLPTSPRGDFFHSLQMKAWKNLDKKETEVTK